jgi:hypothetical protein
MMDYGELVRITLSIQKMSPLMNLRGIVKKTLSRA